MKGFYSFVIISILCLTIALPITLAQQSDSWPMFHYDAAHTGYVNAPGPTTNQTLWTYTAGGWVLTSPVISNGIVYFSASDAGYHQGSNNNLIAVKASDGSKLWNYSVGGKIYSSPAVANDIVYFGSDDDAFYALNATTGAYL
jgi:outer membrane protein assembly factor BamB